MALAVLLALVPAALDAVAALVDAALEEQRSEKYRPALTALAGIGVRAGQLGGTAAWLSSYLVSHA